LDVHDLGGGSTKVDIRPSMNVRQVKRMLAEKLGYNASEIDLYCSLQSANGCFPKTRRVCDHHTMRSILGKHTVDFGLDTGARERTDALQILMVRKIRSSFGRNQWGKDCPVTSVAAADTQQTSVSVREWSDTDGVSFARIGLKESGPASPIFFAPETCYSPTSSEAESASNGEKLKTMESLVQAEAAAGATAGQMQIQKHQLHEKSKGTAKGDSSLFSRYRRCVRRRQNQEPAEASAGATAMNCTTLAQAAAEFDAAVTNNADPAQAIAELDVQLDAQLDDISAALRRLSVLGRAMHAAAQDQHSAHLDSW
jgi:hypothetical protein